MSATIKEIVRQALTVVGEVTGSGVQQYEEDRMIQDAIRAFNMMFKKYNWEQYLLWTTVVLDGVLGIPTTDSFEMVKDFEDFVAVHRAGEASPLTKAPTRFNPSTIGFSTGSRVLFWTSLNATNANYRKRKLLFYPKTSVGSVDVLAKIYPLTPPAVQFDGQQIFYLDADMLIYATAYMTLSGDDLNAGAADVVRNMMEMRYKDVMAALAKQPIPISVNTGIPTYWQERV